MDKLMTRNNINENGTGLALSQYVFLFKISVKILVIMEADIQMVQNCKSDHINNINFE